MPKITPAQIQTFMAGLAGAVVVNVILGAACLSFINTDSGRQQVANFLGVNGAGHMMSTGSGSGASGDTVVGVVASTSPAVVSIVISKDVPIIEQYYDNNGGGAQNPFAQMFPGMNIPGFNTQVPQYRQNGTEKKEVGGGSGFFISDDGYVVTNAHVVSDASASYTVLANDGKKYDAKIIAADDVLDVALLKVEATGMPFLHFSDSDKIQVGQTAIAIGNALGEFRNTVSVGVVSGLSRTIQAASNDGAVEELQNVIQTDAAINPGNSGGPLLDLSGNVIGVNVATSGNASSVSFSLPANMVSKAIDSMKKNGRVIRPYLGVRSILITSDIAQANNLSVDYGAIVQRSGNLFAVVPGSPADKAGIVENDIILKVDGQKIDGDHELAAMIRQKNVGDSVSLLVQHDGKEKTVTVVLEEMPKSAK